MTHTKTPPQTSIRITNITVDRRTKEQLASAAAIDQARADLAIEKIWRARVQANVLARLNERVEAFLRS